MTVANYALTGLVGGVNAAINATQSEILSAAILQNVTQSVNQVTESAILQIGIFSQTLLNQSIDSESLVRNIILLNNQTSTQLQSVVSQLASIGSHHLLMRYLGLGATISGVTLITLAEVARNQKKLRAVCSISGMGLTAFGVSQLFELKA